MLIILIGLIGQLPEIIDPDFPVNKVVYYDAPIQNGSAPRFPYKNPVGTDLCTNVEVKHGRIFVEHPDFDPNTFTWKFKPKTVFIEIMYQKYDNELYPWLILTRQDDIVAAYAPFPTKEDLEQVTGISLKKGAYIVKLQEPKIDLDFNKKVPILHDFPDPVVKELLKWPFKRMDSYFCDTFLPYSEKEFNLVPGKSMIGAVDLDTKSCNTCHVKAGKNGIRGGDKIFSWNPFERQYFESNSSR